MIPELMTERDQLEKAIDLLDNQRDVLGDSVVETALGPLRAKLTALDQQVEGPLTVPSSEMRPTVSPPESPFVGERRVVTILFCDVKGSTAMAEKLDPEEWAQTIQQGLKFLIEPVRRHDGMMAEVRGGGILAFFGAPLTHEDDPQRAVLAGLEIIEGLRTFQEQIQHERGLDFNVRVGIHTGLVVVGEVTRRQRGEYAAFGDAVNLAARMEQTAQPGTVQISAETHRLVEQVFDCESLGEIKVKGKRRPVQSYRVLGLKPKPSSQRGIGNRFWRVSKPATAGNALSSLGSQIGRATPVPRCSRSPLYSLDETRRNHEGEVGDSPRIRPAIRRSPSKNR